MKRFILNISAIVLSVMMVMAVGGFSIVQHYCGCMDEVSASLFIEDDCCTEAEAVSTCCSIEKEAPACCSTELQEDKEHACDGDCCHTDKLYFRMDIPFTMPLNTELAQLTPVILEVPEIELIENSTDPMLDNSFNYRSHAPPPSSSKILTFLNRFKLSPPPVA